MRRSPLVAYWLSTPFTSEDLQADLMRPQHRLQVAAALALEPAKGHGAFPVRYPGGTRQQRLDAGQQRFGTGQKTVKISHGERRYRVS
jgi:hypothetical protein